MSRGDRALFVRTVVHLQPGQIAQRMRLRTQRAALRRFPATMRWLLAGPDPATATGWPAGFTPLDAELWRNWPGFPGLREGRIELLGVSRTLADWAQADAPLLWRFHLYYWDWAWALATAPDRTASRTCFAAMWRSWQTGIAVGRGDAWHPYPAALRAWSYCGVHRDLVAGSEIEDAFVASVSAHAGFLRRHLETDLGGNHLIKDLKAMVGLGVFFADNRLLDQAMDRLIRQLTVQVLPDGGHFERAPAYHCQVLADLIDVDGLIRAAGQEPALELTQAIQRMRRWLGCVLSPDGKVPLLNDGYPVEARLIRLVQPETAPDDRLLVLPDTGLIRASAGEWRLLADVGAPCPDNLPGHAHADTLSCLVHVNGAPLLVDTGTSTYAPGLVRDYERSTAAHNSIEIDGANSTEVWGAFRAARRARVSGVTARDDGGALTAEAAHDGFRRLPGRPVHHRHWTLSSTGLRVDDLVDGVGEHSVTVRWHLPPGAVLRVNGRAVTATTPADKFDVAISASHQVELTAGSTPLAVGFGRTVDAPVLACRINAALPVRIRTVWKRGGNAQGMSADEPAFTMEGAV